MSFATLTRSLTYVTLGAVLAGAVGVYLALYTPSHPTAGSNRESPEGGQVAVDDEPDGSSRGEHGTRDPAIDKDVREFVTSPDAATASLEGEQVARRPSRAALRGPLPVALEPFEADPFDGLPSGNAPAGPSRILPDTKTRTPAHAERPMAFDPRETSWENPFAQEFWEGNGWKFEPQGMSSAGPSTAVFRRAYRRLMLEARLEPLKAGNVPLQLRLLAPETGVIVEISVAGKELLINEKGGSDRRLSERATLDPAPAVGKPGMLRLAATGNRMVFSWNGRIVLACDQPATQSGRDLQLEWKAGATEYRISRLRLEGE